MASSSNRLNFVVSNVLFILLITLLLVQDTTADEPHIFDLEVSSPVHDYDDVSIIYSHEKVHQLWASKASTCICSTPDVYQDKIDHTSRQIFFKNRSPPESQTPILIKNITVEPLEKGIVTVDEIRHTMQIEPNSEGSLTITTHCVNTDENSKQHLNWTHINVTFVRSDTGASVSFFYQRSCSVERIIFGLSFVMVIAFITILVGLGARKQSTRSYIGELKLFHVGLYFLITTGAYILLYSNENKYLKNGILMLFYSIHLGSTSLIINDVFHIFLSERTCFMARLKIGKFMALTLTNVLSVILAGVLVVSSFITRNWLINDVLSVCLLLTLLQSLKITSLKMGVILMMSYFIMQLGWSLVAAKKFGLDWDTTLEDVIDIPLSIKYPHFRVEPIKNCSQVSILEIFLSGIFISFCHRYDQSKGLKIFYVAGMAGFFVGNVIAVGVVVGVNRGLPALFFLIPLVLISVSAVAFRRNEHKELWDGLPSDSEYVAHLIGTMQEQDANDSITPVINPSIFESVDLRLQTERSSNRNSRRLATDTSPSRDSYQLP